MYSVSSIFSDFDFENMFGLIALGSFIALIIRILIAVKFGHAAQDKGYTFTIHFLLCLFFGIIGWLSVCALPDKRSRIALEKIAGSLPSPQQQNQTYYAPQQNQPPYNP